MVTMQTLYHDGGFSSMGISDAIVEAMDETAAEADEDASDDE
jgi:enoyl-[acyl-carrier protein] reductase I